MTRTTRARRSPIRNLLLALATPLILSPWARAEAESPDISPAPITIERTGGPPVIPDVPRDQVICFALYSVQAGVLKLSAQLYPLKSGESREIELQVLRDQRWETVASSMADEEGYLATFRIEGWDASKDSVYRLTHPGGAVYEGRIRRDPADKDATGK